MVLPLSGAAASAWDAANLTTAITGYLTSRGAPASPVPSVFVMPVAGGGVEVWVTFPPGDDGTAGALTLLVDAQQPAPALVTALTTGAGGSSVTIGTVRVTTQNTAR